MKIFNPITSETVERFKFNSQIHKSGELVVNFIGKLYHLVKHCNYGKSLDMMLWDRIVQYKLQAKTGLTLASATEIAVLMKMTVRNAVDLKTTGVSSLDLFSIQQKMSPVRNTNILKRYNS